MYNVERFLPKCLDSILAQTLRDIEVICVDDCSPDGSAAIADGYAAHDSRVRVVRRGVNGTLGFARNSGIDVARGEYIAFVDSDDWIDPGMMEALWGMAREWGADVCCSGIRSVRNGSVDKEVEHPLAGAVVSGDDNVALLRLEFYGALPDRSDESPYPVSSCTSLYRRDFLEEYGLRFNAMRSEDIDFNVRALSVAARVACARGVYYNYRDDSQPSITRSFSEGTLVSFGDTFDRLEALVEAEDPRYRESARLRTLRREVDYGRVLVKLIVGSDSSEDEKLRLVRQVCADPHISCAARAVPARRLTPKQAVFLVGLRLRWSRFLMTLTRLRIKERS